MAERRTSVLGIPIVFPWLLQPPAALMSLIIEGERGQVMRAAMLQTFLRNPSVDCVHVCVCLCIVERQPSF